MSGSRKLAARAVAGVIGAGESLDRALESGADSGTRALTYETLRHGHRLDAILSGLLRTPLKPEDAVVRALLLVSMCELTRFRTPEYAVVDGAVTASRELGKPWAAKLVNGVLRNFLRRRDELEEHVDGDPAAAFSHPGWLSERIRADWPDEAEAVLRAGNEKGPMWLRVNTRRATVEEYWENLAEAQFAVADGGPAPEALRLAEAVDVASLPGFARGKVSVQDGAAQLAAGLLDPAPGDRVLDACCAPGGKTGHLLERGPQDFRVTAVERDADRLELVRGNLERLGLEAELVAGDATDPDSWWDGGAFQRILLDAPCSGTGVIRRHPDIKWLRRPGDVEAHSETQSRLLEALWPLLAPGGRLLYATCSILKAENAERIDAFLARHSDAEAVPLREEWGVASGAGRQILPGEHGMDGFFYALLEKRR